MKNDKNYPYWPPGSPQDFHLIVGQQVLTGLLNIGEVRIPPANGVTQELNKTPFPGVTIATIDTILVNSYSPERGSGEGPGLMDLMMLSVNAVGKIPVKPEPKKEASK